MLPTQRYWQETVSLLNVMWPWSNQRECKLLGKNFQLYNHRPLLSSKNPHFKNEAKCTTFLVKMSFICLTIKNHFHIRGWALKPRFDREAWGNFEVVSYYTYVFNMVKNCWTVMTQGFERTLTRWIDLRITMHDQSSLSFNALFLASQSTVGD